MANQKEHYTSDFKAKVALDALAQSKKNLSNLSEKYDVPVSVILVWAVQLERNAAGVYEDSAEPSDVDKEPTIVDVEVRGNELSQSLEQGVMSDDLNYRRLISWSVLGLLFVIIFTVMLMEMYQVSIQKDAEQIAGENPFYEITNKKQEAESQLSNFGVVDDEQGIYRVPIDMAINQMAGENQLSGESVEFETDSLIEQMGNDTL